MSNKSSSWLNRYTLQQASRENRVRNPTAAPFLLFFTFSPILVQTLPQSLSNLQKTNPTLSNFIKDINGPDGPTKLPNYPLGNTWKIGMKTWAVTIFPPFYDFRPRKSLRLKQHRILQSHPVFPAHKRPPLNSNSSTELLPNGSHDYATSSSQGPEYSQASSRSSNPQSAAKAQSPQ